MSKFHVTKEDVKHVLFPQYSRLIHIYGEEYSSLIMEGETLILEKEKEFCPDKFIVMVTEDSENPNGFYLIDHISDMCWYIQTNLSWNIQVEEFFFRHGCINFIPDEFTLPKGIFDGFNK